MLYWALKVLCTPVARVAFRLRIEGRRRVPRTGPLIVASNHVSFIDSVFIPLIVPRRLTYLAKAEYFDHRLTALFFRALGVIPIRREGGSASQRALESAAEVLRSGGALGIYPEGTRSLDGRLHKGHTGVARLALATGATVVPVHLSGTAAVQPVGSNWLRPFKKVTVRIGAPMRWSGRAEAAADPATLRQVTDEIMCAIGELGGQPPLPFYVRRPRTPPAPDDVDLTDRAQGVAEGLAAPGGPIA